MSTVAGVAQKIEEAATTVPTLCEWGANMMLLLESYYKILIFRDFVDLPPCGPSIPIRQFLFNHLMMDTVEDPLKLYPDLTFCNPMLGGAYTSIHQELIHLYQALKSVSNLLAQNKKWITYYGDLTEENLVNSTLDNLGARVLTKLHHMINIAKEIFDKMDKDEVNKDYKIASSSIYGQVLSESYLESKKSFPSPDTYTSFSIPPELKLNIPTRPPEFTDLSFHPPFLAPLGVQAVQQLKLPNAKCFLLNSFLDASTHSNDPVKQMNEKADHLTAPVQEFAEKLPEKEIEEDPKCSEPLLNLKETKNIDSGAMLRSKDSEAVPLLPLPPPPPTMPPEDSSSLQNQPPHTALPPPAPPIPSSIRSPSAPPPPTPPTKGGAPPPAPPASMAKALRAKKANTKLKRSTHMGKLYRNLKGKVEGVDLNRSTSQARGLQVGGSSGGKQGMAEAIAEMAKRSTYFQQIEEDVKKHGNLIKEIKASITGFQAKDMAELLRFHKYIEQHLEKLTDETQVLSRFEGFPTKKLEALRTAAALYSKLEGIATELQNWKAVPPLSQLLDKVESYFNKIKGEIDALERSKDEEMKRFQSQNILFDFSILVRIKESMVDVSSGCMELALEERIEMKGTTDAETRTKTDGKTRAFVKLLWRAFQLAFRVYTFAGGQDDRADQLTQKLAHKIEAHP